MSESEKKGYVEVGTDFENLLREAVRDHELWIPGIGNGAMGGVLHALNSLNDEDIVYIIRESCK